ncbi:PepSY domain-containing protein [Pseudocolwellia sp. AS88]|uniref:PepSY-associated TM helix domain-containing protein n=1 Tax=Pseudocolwellia sp. AS88 TaxID=3063958 RepID=UPI0026E9A06C|nr:PepSY domain-containing protein [Pseudocolwellia sp. AS88]MDO7086392.1 PepSY domain-containing protein [Pseudocolwellia sp. AS88]
MTKNNTLNQWLWKWHIIAGLLTLPFMLLLALTGTVYLFKDNINNQIYQDTKFITPTSINKLPLSKQLEAAQGATQAEIVDLTLPKLADEATVFKVATEGWMNNDLYVDPYTAKVKGVIEQDQTLMHTVSTLHGELLLGKAGTTVVELVASWFIVLILTGLYVWWPKKNSGLAGFLTIRFSRGKRILFRDLHSVTGFWLSIFMFIILAGGMPWTDIFGGQFKWLQNQTNTGYPQHWTNSRGLNSNNLSGSNDINVNTISPLSLDEVANIAQSYKLGGDISIKLPLSDEGVYTISNRALLLRDQHVIHIDQYSGSPIKSLQWEQVGIMMDLRQVFMRLHQGEYGLVNWSVLLAVALFFIMSTVAGTVSYFMRKPQGQWGIPKVPERFRVDKVLVAFIILLGVVFPLFGASLITIWTWERIKSFQIKRQIKHSNK